MAGDCLHIGLRFDFIYLDLIDDKNNFLILQTVSFL